MRSISLVLRRIAQSLLLVTTLGFGSQQANAQAPAGGGDAAAGAALFKQKCTSCHALDRQVVGPALKGISGKHSEEWLIKWVKNSQALVASGDAEAVKIFNEYNKTVMTPFPELSDDDIKNIIAYTDKGEAPKAGETVDESQATTEGKKEGGISDLLLGGLVLTVIIALLVIVVLNRVIKTLDRIVLQKQGLLPEGAEVEETTAVRFRKLAKNKKFVFFVIILLVALSGSIGWRTMWNTGVHQGYQPTQPIKYSHQLHAGTLKIDCQYCHFSAYKSKNAAIPSLNVCMNCHNYVTASDKYNGEISPEIQKIYQALDYDPASKKYGDNPKPIQWVRVHNLPDLAYFNHSQHVTVAGVKCQECHGPIQTMPEVYQYAPLTMKWCINCHRTREINSKGNAYYDKVLAVHDQLKKGEKVTPAVLGGLECGKCHY